MKTNICAHIECEKTFQIKNPKKRFCSLICKNKAAYLYSLKIYDWEIKQFNVSTFQKVHSAVITLMTPEPTAGYYVYEGIEAFIRKYGYNDKLGREARINFGGIHKYNELQKIYKFKIDC